MRDCQYLHISLFLSAKKCNKLLLFCKFSLFPLKDIASFLNITQTHLSRLRKNI